MVASNESMVGQKTITVTLDTSALGRANYSRISLATRDRPIEIGHVSVSRREQLDAYTPLPGVRIPEGGICGETICGDGVVTNDADFLEMLLDKISNGSFPRRGTVARANLSEKWATERDERIGPINHDGMHNHFRDAMILCAHKRSRRDIFVTNEKFKGGDGHLREELARLCDTEILSVDEFCQRYDGV